MSSPRSPHLSRFLSDFTLGFSDGLTVPFALTAGLSYLGRTQTVIYAGIAELCAGAISMGIGGYLAAIDDLPEPSTAVAPVPTEEDASEMKRMLSTGAASSSSDSLDEKDELDHESAVRRHLAPLSLPSAVISDILSTLQDRPDGLASTASALQRHITTTAVNEDDDEEDELHVRKPASLEPTVLLAIISGMYISLGYLIGGIIPLLPYFFASTVGSALRWSIGLCLVALFTFGWLKCWMLRGRDASWRRCLWEGSQMLVLGGLAALAAVVCVNLMDFGEAPKR